MFFTATSLFRATQGVDSDEPYIERYADPLLGWGSHTSGSVCVYDVPGGHSSMLQEPHVSTLAQYIQACIDSSGAGERKESAEPLAIMQAMN